jgi:hypothetical protein
LGTRFWARSNQGKRVSNNRLKNFMRDKNRAIRQYLEKIVHPRESA